MSSVSDVLVAGAGQAAAQLAISLRQGGYTGSITLVGDEPDLPYERPPLSKEYLTGDRPLERLAFRPRAFWEQRAVTLRLGEHVASVDPDAHEVTTADGTVLRYRHLVWATGGRARPLPLPGAGLQGIFTIRTRADVDALRAALADLAHVVIIGGGFIGLEVAPALLKAGKRVTVLESQERVLARVTSPIVSHFYEAEHRAHGVDLRVGVGIAGLEGRDGTVCAVRMLDGGPALPCDAVIAAIGIIPAVDALRHAGAQVSNGVEVDSFCQTSLRDVFAIGDCANHVNRYAGGARVRLESVQNAVEQAKVVSNAILGKPEPYGAVPWFWSNQYDLKLQTIGLNIGHDETVLRGTAHSRSFTVAYLHAGRVVAFDCINSPRDFVQGKELIERGQVVPADKLANLNLSLKSLVGAT